jgi:Effector-associated domain 11
MRNKKEIRALIADGQMTDALEGAIAYAEQSGDIDTLNGLIALQSDFNKHRSVWNKGEIAFEEYARAQARITNALLARVSDLPDTPSKAATKSRMRKDRFKWLVFYLFMVAKVLVFAWILFVWQTEGLTIAQSSMLFSALLPGMVVHISVMFRHLFKDSVEGEQPLGYVAVRFRNLVAVAFLAYLMIQVILVIQKARGEWPFETMSAAFIGTEAFFGLFIAEIVEGVFKKDKV